MHYLGRLISITISYSLVVAIAERIFTILTRSYLRKHHARTKASLPIAIPVSTSQEIIKPLYDFDYRHVDPIRYRPFEAKRHVVMGIKKSTKSEWIRIDNKYLERLNLRKQLLDQYPEVCMGESELANPAIRELYQEIVLDLLPKRYPTIFRIVNDTFLNLVTGSHHRISTTLQCPSQMLRQLAENVEEDFYFMVPDPQDEFKLQGFVGCFPQGFLPEAKVGMTVSEIHEPVPGYEGRLKKGVNRCFRRMEPGESVGRLNWAIQCNNDTLYLPYDGANTLKDDDSPSQKSGINPSSSFLRVEHHTLTCLPLTKTIVFTIHSYLTPLTQIKSEGSGPALAEACESMPEKFGIYKNRPTWGRELCAWLKEGSGDSKQEDYLAPPPQSVCPFSASSLSEGTCPAMS